MTNLFVSKIGIAGAGGIGAYLAGFLYDLGYNRRQFATDELTIDLYDDDKVDAGNLLHQNFTEDDLGRYKAEVVSERTFGAITPIKRFMTAEDFGKYQVIFSCVDSMTFRKELYEYGWANSRAYWIDGRCSSRNIGLFNSLVPKKALLPTLSESTERRGCLLAKDKEKKVSHITPVIVASLMAQSFLNHIRGEDTTEAILLYV